MVTERERETAEVVERLRSLGMSNVVVREVEGMWFVTGMFPKKPLVVGAGDTLQKAKAALLEGMVFWDISLQHAVEPR